MAKHRVALIGLGMVAPVHAAGLADLADRVEVAWAFSRTQARRDDLAKHYPFPTCDSLDAILADESVDAVIVLTPAATHLDIVRRCAEAGKHVLLEKPVEITTRRATELVETCERFGVTLGIVFQHRFRTAATTLAQLLAANMLGRIATCSASVRNWRPQKYYDEPGRGTYARDGGGVLITQAIHTLDLMLSLAGPVEEVRGYTATTPLHNMESEDYAAAAVHFANGAFGTIEATTAAYPGFPDRIEITGTRGSAVLAGTALDVAYLDGSRRQITPPGNAAGGAGADPMAFTHEWHRAVIADFLDALDEGRPPRVSGREALVVHRLIDALVEAGRTGATVRVAAP